MTRKIRVLQLGSPTGMYGAERWILALVRHLDDTEVESHVGVIKDNPTQSAPLIERAAEIGAKVHVIEATGRVNWQAVRGLRALLKAQKIDILHTHFYKTDIVGLLAARRTGCRLVATPHGWSAQAGITLRAYEYADRMAFKFFDAVVPLSQDLYRGLATGIGDRLHLVTNGVDLCEIESARSPTPEVVAWRAEGAFVVGYIGQLIPRKAVDVLVRAFAGMRVPRKRLVIVGEGAERHALEELAGQLGISDRVWFAGYREDRLSLLKGFTAMALPSRLEGIPRCAMEAMAAGTPVVVSDIPGCRDLIAEGPTALSFPVDDVQSLQAQLESLADVALRKEIARNAERFVRQRFSAEAMATAYIEIYRRILRSSGTSSPSARKEQ